ncbi:hypothetical protein [Streptomyces sp. NPDC090026]|uniref:hypothetical protein n=1 Tax=Streptomyces sp. NPDC090026 TaxID=3365923 RepID=UPI003807133C
MEQNSPLKELASCIERHNRTLMEARGLWADAEQASRDIGHLVGRALSTGTSWTELGRLLATVDDSEVPAGLTPLDTEDVAPKGEEVRAGQESPTGPEPIAGGQETTRVPSQGERTEPAPPPVGEEPCPQTRALPTVREVFWPSGITVETLMRVLAAEGHIVTERQTRAWLEEWAASGQLQRVDADRYLRSGLLLESPTLATGDRVPLLLRRAHQIVAASAEKEMSTRALAAALNENVQIVGGELCAMLQQVGVTRPNRGKIRARYGGTTGPRLPGYTAETLGKAIAGLRT